MRLQKVYNYNPIPSELSEKESELIWGTQGNLWTEYILDFKHVENMVFPRMMALSVAALEHIKNPISVASAVMEKTPHMMLVADGALEFAISQGFKKENLLTPESEKEWKEWLKESKYKPIVNIENHDTIGMIALDANGNLSGACTTSGMAFKMHGRVGDSPIVGAGLFVDNEVGAATATGHGEEVIRTVGTHLVVELMRQGRTP